MVRYYMDTSPYEGSKHYVFEATFCKHDSSNLYLYKVPILRI